jgi:hypothetical protein
LSFLSSIIPLDFIISFFLISFSFSIGVLSTLIGFSSSFNDSGFISDGFSFFFSVFFFFRFFFRMFFFYWLLNIW